MKLTADINEKREQFERLKEQFASECDARANELRELRQTIEATSNRLQELESKTSELQQNSAAAEAELYVHADWLTAERTFDRTSSRWSRIWRTQRRVCSRVPAK